VPSDLPYLNSYKNLEGLFERIKAAKVPEAFSQGFLEDVIGLKSKTDRPLIGMLKLLGFLDGNQRPTSLYSQFKNPGLSKGVMAEAIKKAYAPLFASNEFAHRLNSGELRGLISQVAGADEGMTNKVAWTLGALMKMADFDKALPDAGNQTGNSNAHGNGNAAGRMIGDEDAASGKSGSPLRPEFHYNLQIHLPQNGSEETYLNIFNAIKAAFR
jgi:hypothetical protein